MPKYFTHYDILISCPSDVAEDREVVQKAINNINSTNANFQYLHFDTKYWSEDVLFSHGTPQDIINKNIVYSSDIVIALFGQRLGTPTNKYSSGTIEEIELMIEDGKQVPVC